MAGFGRITGKPGHLWVISAVLMVLLVALLMSLVRSGSPDQKELRVACAAAFRKPMEEIAKQYEQETGVQVALNFGGSGALASQLQIASGDLFFPADDLYLSDFENRRSLLESVQVVRMRPGLVVASGNPKKIQSLNQLTDEGVRVSLANESAAIGREARWAFKERGLLSQMKENLLVTKPTVTEVVEDVALGAADVTIAWDAVVRNDERVELVEVGDSVWEDSVCSIGVLKTAFSQEQAADFANYCANPEKGGAIFKEAGFRLAGE